MAEDNPLFQTDFGKSLLSPSAPTQQPSSNGGDENPLLQTDYMKGANASAPAPSDQKTAQGPTPELSWSDVATQGVKNLPSSAYRFGENLVTPFLHPIDTAENIGQIGKGLYSKAAGVFTDQDKTKKAQDEAAVDAIGKMYADRYGSLSGFKKALSEDPVSIIADAAAVLSGGETALGSVPGAVGDIAKVAGTVGRTIDPMSVAAQVPKLAGKALTSTINIPAAIQSGSAFGSLQKAYEAGVTKDPVFWNHYSGAADANDLIDRVTGAISNVAKQRSDDYLSGMNPIKATSGLDYQPVLDSISNARGAQGKGVGSFYGQTTNRGAQNVLNDIENTVQQWMSQPAGHPNHTLEGFDQLKQAIGDYRQDARGNPQATKVVDDAYNAVKQSIVNVDPTYANIMDQYSNASQQLNDMKSLVRGRTSESQINKILKTYQTGDKSNVLSDLYQYDPQLVSAIAGHDLAPLFPQGLRGIVTSGTLYGASGALGGLAGLVHPAHLAHVALGSPKLMGGLNYGLGRVAGMPENVVSQVPYLARMAPYYAGEAENADRAQRKSGGRVSHETRADQLIAAAERSKKSQSNATEALLDQPDEAITRALSIAKQHI
jgi:hypothetical protein